MSSSQISELAIAHRGMQEKLIHFLMAAAGACIGFALTQAKDLMVERTHLALAMALLLWTASFSFGFGRVQGNLGVILNNIELIRTTSGTHHLTGQNPMLITEFAAMLRENIKLINVQSNRYARLQVGALSLGVLSYVIWQFLLMLQRSA